MGTSETAPQSLHETCRKSLSSSKASEERCLCLVPSLSHWLSAVGRKCGFGALGVMDSRTSFQSVTQSSDRGNLKAITEVRVRWARGSVLLRISGGGGEQPSNVSYLSAEETTGDSLRAAHETSSRLAPWLALCSARESPQAEMHRCSNRRPLARMTRREGPRGCGRAPAESVTGN